MDPFDLYLNKLINKSSQEFSTYPIHWINPYEAIELENIRAGVIERLKQNLNWSFLHTKPWVNRLSAGCELCGNGLWSCLFITGVCNASCFYCPTSQIQDHIPATQQFDFDQPVGYAAYLNRFGFKGCSFSGGEPLLVYDRLKDYLAEIRSSCDPEMYIWMYTNGLLGSEDRYKELTDLGLDEVRFDVGATGYNLKHLEKAAGIVKHLTVEIPAVPHETDRLFELLPQLEALGVSNLNLHSLRLTHHNAKNLVRHPYSYLHGEQVVVLESELLAFRIMEFVADQRLNIGVNYCSSQYKRRFQRSGFRKRVAHVMHPDDFISENGYVLRIMSEGGVQLNINEFLKGHQPNQSVKVSVFGYEFINEGPNFQNPVLSKACPDLLFESSDVTAVIRLLAARPTQKPVKSNLFELWRYVWIEEGLRNYF